MGLMNFNDLLGPKSKPGSIQNFVRHKQAPAEVIIEEAQTYIYSLLRIREMRASAFLSVPIHGFTLALPTGFLEPISMRDREGWEVIPRLYVEAQRLFELRSTDPDIVTTLSGAVTAAATTLGVASAAEFPASGAFSIVIEGETLLVTAGAGTTTWTVTRGYSGTAAAAHATGALVDGGLDSGTPMQVAVFDELFQFDCKADAARYFDLVYVKRPTLLSSTNKTNFLTDRYPHLLRAALNFRAAAHMKDAEERDANEKELIGLIEAVNAESDLGRAA